MATDLTIEQQLRRWALNWEIDDNDWTIQALKQLCEAVALEHGRNVSRFLHDQQCMSSAPSVVAAINAALDRIQQEDRDGD